LSGAAAATSRIRLATGIYLLGLRHPLISARMVATLHEMSGGRFVLGVGSGWLAEEFDALGLEFARRRSRYEEALAILRAAFAGEPFEHHGSEFDFGLVQVCPSPIRVPLVLGGNSDAALRRAASIGDGWFSSGTPTLDHAARLHQRLHELRADLGRTNAFSVHVRMAGASADRFDEYLAAGIDHVVIWADQVWPKDAGPTEKYDVLAQAAQRFGLRGG
jgi:probable F420-dependent oxidoreductase